MGWVVGELRNKTKLQPSSVWLELELSLAILHFPLHELRRHTHRDRGQVENPNKWIFTNPQVCMPWMLIKIYTSVSLNIIVG